MAYPNPPRTWSAAAVLTAAQLNAELRDAFNQLVPTASATLAWANYTPTFTQSATITKTSTGSRFFQVGKIVVASFALSATSSGTANNSVLVGLPVTASSSAPSSQPIGAARITDFGVANYPCIPVFNSTTTIAFLDTVAQTTVFEGQTGAAFSTNIGSGDSVTGFVIYEAA